MTNRQRKLELLQRTWDAYKEIWGREYPDAPIQHKERPGELDVMHLASELLSLLPYGSITPIANTVKEPFSLSSNILPASAGRRWTSE